MTGRKALSGDVKGKLFIDLSTVTPGTDEEARLAQCAPRRALVDARSAAPSGRRATASCSPRRRRARRFRPRQADPRAALPARRPSRAQRRRLGDEARHQPAVIVYWERWRGAVAGA